MLYYEDFEIGHVDRFGHHQVTREEVLAFAAAYDPQPFHLDDEAAATNPIFGRLSASGWHTAAITMRMTIDHSRRSGGFSLAASGLDELRWLKPVYPGDTLSAEMEVIAKSEPRSRPEIGYVKFRTTVFNQDGDPVMNQVANTIQPKRP